MYYFTIGAVHCCTTLSSKMEHSEDLKTAIKRLAEQNALPNPEETSKYYEDWAKEYEKDVKLIRTEEPKSFVKFVTKHLTDKHTFLLDLGAGTGMVGSELDSVGFDNIEAHDGAIAMLELAQSKDVYKKHYVEIFQEDQMSQVLPHKHYDAVVSFDAFSKPELLNENHLEAVFNLVKPGGIVPIGGTVKICDELFNEKVTQLEKKGICKLIEKEVKENYLMLHHQDAETGKAKFRDAIYMRFDIF